MPQAPGRMRNAALGFLLAIGLGGMGAPAAADGQRAPVEPLLAAGFLRDYAETRGFHLGRPTGIQVAPGGDAILFLRSGPRSGRQGLFEFHPATGDTRELITPEKLAGAGTENLSPEEKARRERMRVSVGGFTSFQLSEDGRRVLAPLGGRLFLIERASGMVREVPVGAGAFDSKLSPDGRSVGFVRDHDVHVVDLASGRERAVTRGGTAEVTHGEAEFVAAEEMARYTGWWWAPDSRSILFEECDARGVELWHVADPADPGAAPRAQYYPRPGRSNVTVRLGIARVGRSPSRTPAWVSWDRDRYPYLTHADWHRAGGLTIVVQTRDQREVALLRVDPASGQTRVLLTEQDPAWVNLDPQMPRWLEDGSGFLWTSERAGAWQLELRAPDGAPGRVVVPPAAGYQGLVHLDSASASVVVSASVDPTQSHLYLLSLAGGEPRALTRGEGVHGGIFGLRSAHWVHLEATPNTLTRAVVRRLADGEGIGELPSVAEHPGFEPRAESVPSEHAGGFHAEVVRPRDFVGGRLRYPVVVDVYGGPLANVVQASMEGRLLAQWLADQGFIVVSLDNRGTPRRGRDWERAIAAKFGVVPLEDQVAGLRALGAQFPEMDLSRVGIVGWSFGGYASALAVLRRPDVFAAAVAGAPVTDWLDYDTHYTERYLGVPAPGDTVYAANSLIADAPNLSRPLLLIHGTGDDNVFFRHSLKLADALFRAGKPFEILPLPGLTHMVPDPVVMERQWTRTAGFLREHLGIPR